MKRLDALLWILLVGLLFARVAEAGRSVAVEAVLKVYCADEKGGRHPSKTRLTQFITSGSFAHADELALLLTYESTQCCARRPGVVKASIARELPNGSSDDLGNLKIKTDEASTSGEALKSITGGAPRGTSFLWDLDFKKFDKLSQDSCISVFSALAK